MRGLSRHADAHRVSLSLMQGTEELTLSIYDDGKGFDASDPERWDRSGLTGMRERAGLVNGTLAIKSIPSQGTRVNFRVPLVQGRAEERA